MKTKQFLIAYDIRDKKRLSKIFRFLSRHCVQCQYSIFFADISLVQLNHIKETVFLIASDEDDIRIYPVGGLGAITQWGKGVSCKKIPSKFPVFFQEMKHLYQQFKRKTNGKI